MALPDSSYIITLRDALTGFYTEVGSFFQEKDSLPCPEASSQACMEQASFPRPESLVTACSIAVQLIESGGEHLAAFVKTITEPIEPIACWTCVRSMLEPCALAAWLLDPTIDARIRVGRVFAHRYEGLKWQLKFGQAAGRDSTELAKEEARINTVEQHALSLGFSQVLDAKGKRIGIGQKMPSTTNVIKLMLDEEVKYRLLSAVAHGHQWAITKLAFEPAATPSGNPQMGNVTIHRFEKTANIQGIAMLGICVAKAWARALWYQWRYFGWDETRLKRIFERTFDHLQATPAVRFWR